MVAAMTGPLTVEAQWNSGTTGLIYAALLGFMVLAAFWAVQTVHLWGVGMRL